MFWGEIIDNDKETEEESKRDSNQIQSNENVTSNDSEGINDRINSPHMQDTSNILSSTKCSGEIRDKDKVMEEKPKRDINEIQLNESVTSNDSKGISNRIKSPLVQGTSNTR